MPAGSGTGVPFACTGMGRDARKTHIRSFAGMRGTVAILPCRLKVDSSGVARQCADLPAEHWIKTRGVVGPRGRNLHYRPDDIGPRASLGLPAAQSALARRRKPG